MMPTDLTDDAESGELPPPPPGSSVRVNRLETETGIFVIEVSPVYQIKSVAKIMDLTPQSVRAFIRRGELRAFDTRAGKRINHEDLVEFLEEYYSKPPVNTGPNAGFHKAMAARGITDYKGAMHVEDDE